MPRATTRTLTVTLLLAALLAGTRTAAADGASAGNDTAIAQLQLQVDALHAEEEAHQQGHALAAMIDLASMAVRNADLSAASSRASLLDSAVQAVRSMQDACWEEVVPLCPRAAYSQLPGDMRTRALLECMQSPLNADSLSDACAANLTAALQAAWQSRAAVHDALRAASRPIYSVCAADMEAVCGRIDPLALQQSDYYGAPQPFLERMDDIVEVDEEGEEDDDEEEDEVRRRRLQRHSRHRDAHDEHDEHEYDDDDEYHDDRYDVSSGWQPCEDVRYQPMYRAASCLRSHFEQLSDDCQMAIMSADIYEMVDEAMPMMEDCYYRPHHGWIAPVVLMVVSFSTLAVCCARRRRRRRQQQQLPTAAAPAASLPVAGAGVVYVQQPAVPRGKVVESYAA